MQFYENFLWIHFVWVFRKMFYVFKVKMCEKMFWVEENYNFFVKNNFFCKLHEKEVEKKASRISTVFLFCHGKK